LRSLKLILITRYTLPVIAVLALLSLLVLFPIRTFVYSLEESDLEDQARLFAGQSRRFFTGEMAAEVIDAYLKELVGELPLRLTIIDTEGNVLGDSEFPAAQMENHAGRPEVAAALKGEVSSAKRESRTLEEVFIYAAAPVVIDGGIRGVARVSVEQRDIAPVTWRVWWIFLGALGLLLLVIVAASIWTERTVVKSLNDLREAVADVAAGELGRRVTAPEVADFSELADNFNAMAEQVRLRIEEADGERRKLETILDNVSSGVMVADAGNHILLLNPAAAHILNVEAKRVVGRRLIEVFPSTDLEAAVSRAAAGEGVEAEMELVYPRKMTLRLKSYPVKASDGRVAVTVNTLEDVAALRQVDRMRQDFVANVSHELRTPVATVRALTDSLLAGALEDRDTAVRFLRDLDRETTRLSQLIEDLLTLSRLEARETVLRMERFDPGELLAECVESKATLAAEYEVGVVVEGDPGMEVEADRRLLATLVGNLLDNAIKYNRPGGKVYASCRAAPGGLAIEVRDTGVGMPREELPRVFERFYRVDRARSRETGGTGLGLSIVKHIAELHGGVVSVESEVGEGSNFRVFLPQPPPAAV